MPDGKTRVNSFSILEDKNDEILKSFLAQEATPEDQDYIINAKNYYQSCMDLEKMEEIGLQPYLDTPQAKEFPTLLGRNWTGEASFDLDDVNERYMAASVDPLFSYSVSTDIMNSSRRVITLVDPHLSLSREYLLRPRNDTVLQAFEKRLKDVAVALGADENVAAEDASDVLDLEIQLANITTPQEQRRDFSKMYNPTTLGALRQNYSYLDIPRGVRAAFTLSNVTLDDDQDVTVYFPSFFEKLEGVLAAADKRTLMNLYGFKFAMPRIVGLTKRMREISLEWGKVAMGQMEEPPRWKTCLSATTSVFSFGIAKEFTRRKFSEDSKQYMDVMIQHLKESFRKILEDANWMTDKTKAEAFQKLEAMGRKVGYPDTNFNDEYFSEKYKNLTMSTNNYYQNRLTQFWTGLIEFLRKLKEPIDSNDWAMPPHEVNAYYDPSENEI
ncbi:hypothetical protein EGW08_016229, partial [Elysia chlorotica]